MKEPKTLKDIEIWNDRDKIKAENVSGEELRQSAKEWIKYLTQPESPEENIWIADWIKNFFNLEIK